MTVLRKTLADQVREVLKRRILMSELHRGDRVDVEKLANELDVSPSPVKDALRQLAIEGLVEIKPRSGTLIRSFDRRDVIDIYGCRRMIEPAAAASVAASGAGPALAETLNATIDILRNASEGEKFIRPFEVSEADATFHRAIIEAAGNRVLAELHTMLIDRALVVRSYASSGLRALETIDEHLAILGALVRADPDDAATASRRHLDQAEAFVLETMDDENPKTFKEDAP